MWGSMLDHWKEEGIIVWTYLKRHTGEKGENRTHLSKLHKIQD